jgi:hypothetical protein
VIKGKARGSWFFEASFSGLLFDEKDKPLASVTLGANENWMTNEFVDFSGKLEFPKPTTKKGTLILRNANPSGDPSRDKSLRIPIKF